MAQSRTYLSGFREARETLQDLRKATQNTVKRKALRPGADLLVQRLQARTPVSADPHDKTPGSLRDNTKVVKAKGAALTVLIDDPAAVPMEYGRRGQQAKPYAKATERSARAEVAVRVGDQLVTEVNAQAKRAARRAAKGK